VVGGGGGGGGGGFGGGNGQGGSRECKHVAKGRAKGGEKGSVKVHTWGTTMKERSNRRRAQVIRREGEGGVLSKAAENFKKRSESSDRVIGYSARREKGEKAARKTV